MAKTIYCPTCKCAVLRYDGKTLTPVSCLCRKCARVVRYYPQTNETVITDKPPRTTSSGVRFW